MASAGESAVGMPIVVGAGVTEGTASTPTPPIPSTSPGSTMPMAPPISTSAGPSAATLQEWAAADYPLGLVGIWAGIPQISFAAILDKLGLAETEHMRVFSDTSPEELFENLSGFVFNGHGLAFGLKAKLRIMLNACRLACGLGPYVPHQAPPTIIYQSPPTAASPATPTPQKPADETVDVDTIVQQGTKKEVPLMPLSEFYALQKAYRKRMGRDPPIAHRPTREQMSAFKYLVDKKDDTYVDMAVWLPHGDRNQGRKKFNGMMFNAKGELVLTEFFGPANYHEWEESFMLFRVACISLDLVEPETLDTYARMIREAAYTFPDSWAIVYQADSRTRREHTSRVRYELTMAAETELKNGWEVQLDKAKPWESVFHKIVTSERDWWNDQLKEPARDVATGLIRMAQVIGGDALVSQGAASSGSNNPAPGVMRSDVVPITGHKRPITFEVDTGTRVKQPRLAITDGPAVGAPPPPPAAFEVSRRGTRICEGYQTGACTITTRGKCAADGISLHICSICRQTGHGAHYPHCPRLGGAVQGQDRGRGGRGRRRGRGGGKGGRKGE